MPYFDESSSTSAPFLLPFHDEIRELMKPVIQTISRAQQQGQEAGDEKDGADASSSPQYSIFVVLSFFAIGTISGALLNHASISSKAHYESLPHNVEVATK